MKRAQLQFQIKRGIVDADGLDSEILDLVTQCVALCNRGLHQEATSTLLPSVYFEWIWSNCEGNPLKIFSEVTDFSFSLDDSNSLIKVGVFNGDLMITATAWFDVQVKEQFSLEDVGEWLSDSSAYSCGYIGSGWGYKESDGDNVWITKLA